MTTGKPPLLDLLGKRYQDGKWFLLEELSQGRSNTAGRIDAAAYPCWASAGNHPIAFECKAVRGDFLSELKAPLKRRWVEEHFAETWFVVERDVVKEPSEVPEKWGLMVRTKKGDGLRVEKRPTWRDVPALREVEIMVIRRLFGLLDRERQKVYRFKGEELTPDQLHDLASAEVAEMRAKAGEYLLEAGRKQDQLNQVRIRLEAPFIALRREAGIDHWRLGEVTQDDVVEWVRRARAKPDTQLLPAMRKLHRELSKVLEAGAGD